MTISTWGRADRRCVLVAVAAFALAALVFPTSLSAQEPFGFLPKAPFYPGNLVVSRSVYDNRASNLTVGQALPPDCPQASGGCVTATSNGLYPYVFNNDVTDASFGITSRIYLDQMTPWGWPVSTLEVPNSLQWGVGANRNQLVTSFSSKSELALNLSTDHRYLTFMGYVAPVNAVDASNSNTPGIVDPTNPAGDSYYRAVARVDQRGNFTFTETRSYSGNNGRAAILNNSNGNEFYYAAGNAGNGADPEPVNVILGAGAQLMQPTDAPESVQNPPLPPLPLGGFSVSELGDKPDKKVGKDTNFRGIAIFNNVLYYTKGSGGNGVNTVYFVDTTGTACPKGTGLPVAGAALPNQPLSYDPSTIQTSGLPNNMCVLNGFPTLSNKAGNPVNFPFGIWFADANTLYVADEGDSYTGGTDLYTHAAAQTLAGLEKWVFNAATGSWTLAYTLTNGLNLGAPYTVRGYPTGNNLGTATTTIPTGLPWSPATDGLRNLTGKVNRDGTVTIWAVTSTVSGSGDPGADPNRLVVITDKLNNTTAAGAASEKFYTLRTAQFAEVLRGVSFTPGTGVADDDHDSGK